MKKSWFWKVRVVTAWLFTFVGIALGLLLIVSFWQRMPIIDEKLYAGGFFPVFSIGFFVGGMGRLLGSLFSMTGILGMPRFDGELHL